MTDQRQDILTHLQAAARELIAAGRAALDMVDEAVSDGIRLFGAYVGGREGPPDPPPVEKIEVERDDA